ncbi:type VII secretion protein EccE [Tessaracoccus sp. SD287]|uniref:type VII secretion protein EccE n=1 Tax=Tessaracoccus sp. SD287 TaxID=2782008 RepID=UPI001A974303|nr:type VII secretion protein EccE [Tessaracoccus sp. SD287]MBO1030305.1 type VII secretion protein EccE [Tessaracoccus sp. SD287]
MARAAQLAVRTPRRLTTRFWMRSLGWELAIAAAVLFALTSTRNGYLIAGVVAGVALLVGIPVKGRSLIGWADTALGYLRRRGEQIDEPADMPVDLVPLAQWVPGLTVNQTRSAQGAEVGVVTDGRSWTGVLALNSDDVLVADSGEKIDLDALSGLTRQDDIVFAGLQVVTYTVPAPVGVLFPDGSPAPSAYTEVSGADMPPAVRMTWLCVRLDPRLCLEAVARRGASTDGIYATLRFGMHRVQAALKRQGIVTRALTPLEIYDVLSLTSGSTPDHGEHRSSEEWTTWQCDGLSHTGRHVRSWGSTKSLGYQALLQALNNAPVLFAVTSFTLDAASRATGAVRLAAPTAEQATAAADVLAAALPTSVKLSFAGGAQVPAMLATVPLGKQVER